MNSQLPRISRQIQAQVSRTLPSAIRRAPGASTATSTAPFHQYASTGLRQIITKDTSHYAPADWGRQFRDAKGVLKLFVPVTTATLFWPLPIYQFAGVLHG